MSTLGKILGTEEATPTEPKFNAPGNIGLQLLDVFPQGKPTEAKPEPVIRQHTPAPTQTGANQIARPEKKVNPQEPAPASVIGEAKKQQKQSEGVSPVTTVPQSEQRMTYEEIFRQMNPYKPMSPEDVAKEQKRQKRDMVFSAIGDGISALANLYFTSQGAPNAYDPKTSMSAKTKSYWDKLTKEREANAYRYTSGVMSAMQADDAADRDDRSWRRLLDNDRKREDQQKAEAAYRKERDQKADERYEAEMERQKEQDKKAEERWQKEFDQKAEQIRAANENEKKRVAAEGRRLAREMAKDEVTFALGARKGVIKIPKDALNEANVSYVFSKLPEEVRAKVQGKPVYGKDMTGETVVVGYEPVDTEAMLITIGANIEDNLAAQDALREIAGQKPLGKKPNPMN